MIKLFSDGADYNGIVEAAKNTKISGFTTNPTLMKQAGVENYETFAKNVISHLSYRRPETCLSLEVFADDLQNMYHQAKKIHSWSPAYAVYVKIPVMNTAGVPNYELINKLSHEGLSLNVTAVFTFEQVKEVYKQLDPKSKSIISIFAGRIADAGYDPADVVYKSVLIKDTANVEFLWASSREAYNYVQAQKAGCDIITMTPDLIKKVEKFGKDLNEFSLETCKMFYNDAVASGYKI